jgi:parvulin-like peptidyl-prolyl isomerase
MRPVLYDAQPLMRYLFFILCAALLTLAAPARAELVSGVSVVVNDAVITYSEIERAMEPKVQLAAKLYANDRAAFEAEVNKLRDQQLEQLIERKLILHEFVSAGYATNVVESFIDDQIRTDIQKNYYGDRARLIQTLHAEGMTYEMFRRQEREDFIIRYMVYQNVSAPKKVLISPLKIEQYYGNHKDEFKVDDEVKVRMIVIPDQTDAPGEARKIATEILAKIDSGVPFKEMASVYSAGSQRAEGGDRGWVDRKFFRPELADAVFSLKPGQHSGIIEVAGSCYLMMVEDARIAHVKPLTEVRADIERTLKDQENSRLRDQWINRLKKKSFIEYY